MHGCLAAYYLAISKHEMVHTAQYESDDIAAGYGIV